MVLAASWPKWRHSVSAFDCAAAKCGAMGATVAATAAAPIEQYRSHRLPAIENPPWFRSDRAFDAVDVAPAIIMT